MNSPVRMLFGPFTLVPAQRLLLRDGKPVPLGSRAFDILTMLVENAGSVVGKEALIGRVWPDTVVDEGSLRVHVAALRKALGEDQSGERHIANVPRRGYSFASQVVRTLQAAPSPASLPQADGPVPGLPIPPGRMIGRDEATGRAVQTLLQRRFLTLAGPGGIGKTTVAVAAAAGAKARHGMRIHFADLGGLAMGATVDAAVALALGIRLGPGERLLDAIESAAEGPFVLVLDNCEHVVASAALLAQGLLHRLPTAYLIATSREPLRASGEWVQRLQPLALPPPHVRDYDEALCYAAFELFVERTAATADQPRYGDADVPDIAEICHRLEGNPLGIELVAAQVGFFGLGGLIAQLGMGLDMPTAGWRSAAPRHQSIRQSLQWSFDLLSEAEKRMLSRLSAFAGHFTLEAAAAHAPGDDGYRETALALMGLVNKSLVWAEGGSDMRYRLCETTRAFAAGQAQDLAA